MNNPALLHRLLAMVSRATQLHRALFVMATTGVAISASRVASELTNVSSWLFVVGFGLLLFSADHLKSVEETAVALARTSDHPLHLTRVDVFITSDPWRTISTGMVGLLIIAVGTLSTLG